MRVLRVISSLNPQLGGASVAALNSAVSGARAGLQSDVAVMVWRGERSSPWWLEVETRCAREGIELIGLPASSGHTSPSPRDVSLDMLRWLARRKRRYDVVHAESPWTGACATALITQLGRSAPLVISPHEVFTPFGMTQGRRGARIAKRIGARVYGKAASLVVCSSPLEMRDTATSGLPVGSLDWIYHAVLDDLADIALPPIATPERIPRLRVGYLGRIDPKKNIDLIVEAVADLGAPVSLAIAGGGDQQLEESLRRQADRLLPGRAAFVGWVNGKEKASFLAGLDVLVMPSEYECFGVAAIEALGAGVPVIAGNRVGVADIIRGRRVGAVVIPTAAGIAAALRRYLDDPASRIADAGRARPAALADASFAAHGARLADVYSGLLARSRR